MPLVQIIKDWDHPDLMRQTPGGQGIWSDFRFTVEPVAQADYVIVLNRVPQEQSIECSPDRIWTLIQEPPIAEFRWLRKGFGQSARVFTPDVSLRGARYVHTHGALPWHVGKSYDDLKQSRPPEKPRTLSWITSSASRFKGHKKRLAFLERLRREVDFDLWGRGFTPIDDKWDGLAPYRYSLAVENYQGAYYWSEKLADCFLSWTMPIYCGCMNIADYFPKESFIAVDIESHDAVQIVGQSIQSDLWRRNRDAIAHARELVLERYQLFPFITDQIRVYEQLDSVISPQMVSLEALPWLFPEPVRKRLLWRLLLAQRSVRNRIGSLVKY